MIQSFSILGSLYTVVMLILGGLGIYCLILFVMLAQKGITALDIYIKDKERRDQ